MICLRLKLQRSSDKLRSPNHITINKASGYKRSAFFVTKRGIIDNMCKTFTARRNKDNHFKS
jgi:hypothetical protein